MQRPRGESPCGRRSIGIAPRPSACPFKQAGPIGVVSSATVGAINGKKTLWVGGGNGNMYALDASTGAVIWKTRLGSSPLHVLWSSPAFFDGSIYEGVASWNDCPDINGNLVRLDAATGSIQATFTPSVPSNCVGVGIWSSVAPDPSTNAIYVGTGPTYLRSDPSKPCLSPDEQGVVRLNPNSLALESRWQLPPNQAGFDLDFGATPMLFTATIGGVNRELVGAENKNGFYYVFDRDNLAAGPVWSYQAEDDAALSSVACEDRNTISASTWAGQGNPVIVAGIALNGSSCIGTITALDAGTGRPIWQAPVGGVVQGAVTQVPGWWQWAQDLSFKSCPVAPVPPSSPTTNQQAPILVTARDSATSSGPRRPSPVASSSSGTRTATSEHSAFERFRGRTVRMGFRCRLTISSDRGLGRPIPPFFRHWSPPLQLQGIGNPGVRTPRPYPPVAHTRGHIPGGPESEDGLPELGVVTHLQPGQGTCYGPHGAVSPSRPLSSR